MKRRRAAVLDIGLPASRGRACRRIMATPMSALAAAPAYKFSVEDSIYIDKTPSAGRRPGAAAVLIAQCTALGKRQMVAVIGRFGPNAVDPAPCFVRLRDGGTLKSIGFKFGRWLDTRADAA